ncbi:hypothetical protein ACHHV8_05490 [Paenibacillus sp. TAB 01]|uniref:hypothetical protein n=1 Tax=Paenibacillus sp. TAB 01 TaxID=3368988 RepID=UPI003752F86A
MDIIWAAARRSWTRYTPVSPPPAPLRLMYVPQGFPAIDQGIISALQRTVREVFVGSPQHMLEQARQMKPDIVLVLNGLHVFPATICSRSAISEGSE